MLIKNIIQINNGFKKIKFSVSIKLKKLKILDNEKTKLFKIIRQFLSLIKNY